MHPGVKLDETLYGRLKAWVEAANVSAAFRRNHRIRNEHLTVEELAEPDQEVLERVLNELSRAEVINMGVIWCPQPRFYPISLERFIVSVLDREFR